MTAKELRKLIESAPDDAIIYTESFYGQCPRQAEKVEYATFDPADPRSDPDDMVNGMPTDFTPFGETYGAPFPEWQAVQTKSCNCVRIS